MTMASRDLFKDAIPPHLKTLGELASWLDDKPPAWLFAYLMHGTGELERLACLNALIRLEIRHQSAYHSDLFERLPD